MITVCTTLKRAGRKQHSDHRVCVWPVSSAPAVQHGVDLTMTTYVGIKVTRETNIDVRTVAGRGATLMLHASSHQLLAMKLSAF